MNKSVCSNDKKLNLTLQICPVTDYFLKKTLKVAFAFNKRKKGLQAKIKNNRAVQWLNWTKLRIPGWNASFSHHIEVNQTTCRISRWRHVVYIYMWGRRLTQHKLSGWMQLTRSLTAARSVTQNFHTSNADMAGLFRLIGTSIVTHQPFTCGPLMLTKTTPTTDTSDGDCTFILPTTNAVWLTLDFVLWLLHTNNHNDLSHYWHSGCFTLRRDKVLISCI